MESNSNRLAQPDSISAFMRMYQAGLPPQAPTPRQQHWGTNLNLHPTTAAATQTSAVPAPDIEMTDAGLPLQPTTTSSASLASSSGLRPLLPSNQPPSNQPPSNQPPRLPALPSPQGAPQQPLQLPPEIVDEGTLVRHLQALSRTLQQSLVDAIHASVASTAPQPHPTSPAPTTARERRARTSPRAQPRRRDRDRITHLEKIRIFFETLQGTRTLDELVVPDAELEAFKARWETDHSIACCSSLGFFLDLRHSVGSPWNKSALQVFARAFSREHGVEVTRDLLKDISQHFAYRIKLFQKLESPEDRLGSQKAARRRAQRKSFLYYSRIATCSKHPFLQQHVGILKALGTLGMSSDESDHGEVSTRAEPRLRAPRYTVLWPQWRHPALDDWLQLIDSVAWCARRCGPLTGGSHRRCRIRTGRMSTSPCYVTSLPRSLYNAVWLASRVDTDYLVQPTNEPFLIEHHPDVLKFVKGVATA